MQVCLPVELGGDGNFDSFFFLRSISTVFLSLPFVCGKMNKKYFNFRRGLHLFDLYNCRSCQFFYTKDLFGLLLKFDRLECGYVKM